jgi:tetratricopeptide (TPR) repeat protein
MASPEETQEERLERQLEQALCAGRSKSFLLPQLEKLASMAAVGSRAYCFANRTLAELLVEQAPWRAALHARRVVLASPDDEPAHALLGLALAVQGNYRAAIASYRRALARSPSNPWYAHNVGHLLDIALDKPRDGLAFLRAAHREAPDQDDVTSSLAHCLARCGARAEALELAAPLAKNHAHRADFQGLVEWIEAGDPSQPRPSALLAPHAFDPDPTAQTQGASAPSTDWVAVTRTLIDRIDLEPEQRVLALSVLSSHNSLPIHDRVAACAAAAAIEYAVCARTRRARTQRALADEYGLSIQSLREWVALVRPLVYR